MFKNVEKEDYEKLTKALLFYDENKILPWKKKKILITIDSENFNKLKSYNKSKMINMLISKHLTSA